MKKNQTWTIIGIIAGVIAALGAIAAVLYVLDKKGIFKLRKTNFTYTEDFPEDELPE